MMEDYFEQTGKKFYAEKKCEDAHPEWHYLSGATPEFIEKARCHSDKLEQLNLSIENMPKSPVNPVHDAKWRFLWKIGLRPKGSADDFPQVIPKSFPDWETKMNKWGNLMHQAVNTIAEMSAIGMSLPRDTFT